MRLAKASASPFTKSPLNSDSACSGVTEVRQGKRFELTVDGEVTEEVLAAQGRPVLRVRVQEIPVIGSSDLIMKSKCYRQTRPTSQMKLHTV